MHLIHLIFQCNACYHVAKKQFTIDGGIPSMLPCPECGDDMFMTKDPKPKPEPEPERIKVKCKQCNTVSTIPAPPLRDPIPVMLCECGGRQYEVTETKLYPAENIATDLARLLRCADAVLHRNYEQMATNPDIKALHDSLLPWVDAVAFKSHVKKEKPKPKPIIKLNWFRDRHSHIENDLVMCRRGGVPIIVAEIPPSDESLDIAQHIAHVHNAVITRNQANADHA